MQATGPILSLPTTPVVRLMMTPGQASRMAVSISAATSGSQLGKRPMPGVCWRRCTCMIEAPASKASRAAAAISAAVTGTGGRGGAVSTPVSAQVRMALSMVSVLVRLKFDVDQQGLGLHLVAHLGVHGLAGAGG